MYLELWLRAIFESCAITFLPAGILDLSRQLRDFKILQNKLTLQ